MNRNKMLSPIGVNAALGVCLIIALAVALPAISAPAPHPTPRYNCTVIDDTVGKAFIEARSINNNGQVVGTAIGHLGVKRNTAPGSSEYWHGFLWSNNRFTDLGVLPGATVSDANCINDHGQIVGTSGPLGRSGHAFVWQGGKIRPLATRYGLGSDAHFISNNGRVAGNAETTDRRTEAAVWTVTPGSDPEKVAPWMVPNQDDALEVNIHDQVLCSARYQAYLWSGGQMINIGNLGGGAATGTGLNDLGEVVGVSVTADQRTHVFSWMNGALKDLDAKPPGVSHITVINELNDINNEGQAVGVITVNRQMHALLYEHGNINDLNEFITPYRNLTLEIARAINDRGQIVGEGHCGNRPVAFLLTPINPLRASPTSPL